MPAMAAPGSIIEPPVLATASTRLLAAPACWLEEHFTEWLIYLRERRICSRNGICKWLLEPYFTACSIIELVAAVLFLLAVVACYQRKRPLAAAGLLGACVAYAAGRASREFFHYVPPPEHDWQYPTDRMVHLAARTVIVPRGKDFIHVRNFNEKRSGPRRARIHVATPRVLP